jgi:hypothetical protein
MFRHKCIVIRWALRGQWHNIKYLFREIIRFDMMIDLAENTQNKNTSTKIFHGLSIKKFGVNLTKSKGF